MLRQANSLANRGVLVIRAAAERKYVRSAAAMYKRNEKLISSVSAEMKQVNNSIQKIRQKKKAPVDVDGNFRFSEKWQNQKPHRVCAVCFPRKLLKVAENKLLCF